MHVACAADEAYAPHCAAMLHSVIEHAPPRAVCIHFLHGPSLAQPVRDSLEELVRGWGASFRGHCIEDGEVDGLPATERISRVMWYRVLLPKLLPQEDRVLYLDCDTIVTDDLLGLWTEDLGENYLAAVTNVFDRGMDGRARAVGLDRPDQYFNSGVLLLNLAAWRRDRCVERIVEFARTNARNLLWPDQDALNAVLGRRRRALHPRWNCQNSLFYFARAEQVFGAKALSEARRRPGILHFEGPELAKPWHYLCKHPYRDQYHRHLAATPWPRRPPEGRTIRNRFLRLLPMKLLPGALRFTQRVDNAVRRRLSALRMASP